MPGGWALIGTSACLGIGSLCLGHREHRRKRALAILSIGLALLAVGRITEERGKEGYGLPFVVIGGFTVAVAHGVNRRLCLACRACQMAPQEEKNRRRDYP